MTVKLGATTLGTATLDNAPQAALPGFDMIGTASVDVVVPAAHCPGPMTLTLVGADDRHRVAGDGQRRSRRAPPR